jgi:hypothetical protein
MRSRREKPGSRYEKRAPNGRPFSQPLNLSYGDGGAEESLGGGAEPASLGAAGAAAIW